MKNPSMNESFDPLLLEREPEHPITRLLIYIFTLET